MIRKVVEIDEEKCNGCGLCVSACHEGAIQLVDGKAKLIKDDYCDGLGDCLPSCPTDAISIVEREAAPYDESAVIAAQMAAAKSAACAGMPSGGCPGSMAKKIEREDAHSAADVPTQLGQWPVQIKLVPSNAAYFDGADLLIAADCSAFAYGNFHNDFMKGRVCLIGCPKLDGVDYMSKLTDILSKNDIRGVTVARMQVPCCGGLEQAARAATYRSGKDIPFEVVTISTDGNIVSSSGSAKITN